MAVADCAQMRETCARLEARHLVVVGKLASARGELAVLRTWREETIEDVGYDDVESGDE